jgi:hypothetical protein
MSKPSKIIIPGDVLFPGSIVANTTVFFDRAEADNLAGLCQAEDADWTYRVEARGEGWVVKVRDEDGYHVGNL